MILLKIVDVGRCEKFRACGDDIDIVYEGEFKDGDKIIIDLQGIDYIAVKLDEHLEESIVYCPNKRFYFIVPRGRAKDCYHSDSFEGTKHRLRVREVTKDEFYSYRKISLNSHDSQISKCYPHAVANFVTRNEAYFLERNAIDGVIRNESHGYYPYHSWAGGAREDLEYWLYFGTEVEVDKIDFYLRADFPHDTYWKSMDVEFSDGSVVPASFEETAAAQRISFEPKVTSYIHLTNFKQAAEPLSWAALTQIEVFGKYIEEDLSKMEVRNAANSKDVKHYTTDRLREEFLIQNLFTKDNSRMVYSHIDRIITAGFMPVYGELKLEAGKELAADYFLQRREMGCINIGGAGVITIDGTEYQMNPRDGIYVGMGNKEISFRSVDSENPAKFYVSSCPAHKEYPIVKIDITKAKKVPCGSVEDCNKRVINQYIHPEVMQSCQLSMGLTELEPGSNWNTMPTHTHDRRMEVYLYLDMGEDDAVFHMMGEPTETRHIVMHNEEAVISPSWSIHSGVGTKNYSFIWSMCGENQEFTDMDHIETRDLR